MVSITDNYKDSSSNAQVGVAGKLLQMSLPAHNLQFSLYRTVNRLLGGSCKENVATETLGHTIEDADTTFIEDQIMPSNNQIPLCTL